MYIESLHVRNLKLLEDFELEFVEADGSPRMWTVIIGKNNTRMDQHPEGDRPRRC